MSDGEQDQLLVSNLIDWIQSVRYVDLECRVLTLQVREEEVEKVVLPSGVHIDAVPRTTCHPRKTYIISGGLGGFGMELGSWLVDRGATKLVVTSRSGVRTGYQCSCIERWRRGGVEVKVSTCNIKCRSETEQLLKEAVAMGEVGGVFHLAMVSVVYVHTRA